MMLHFAAGKAFDDLGDYATAMSHFGAGNGIRRQLAPFSLGAVEKRVESIIARFTPEFFANHAKLGDDDPTPILIIGMPRSGTTLLERIISNHPKVRGGGELEYWNERGQDWVDAEPKRLAEAADHLRRGYLGVLRGGALDVPRATDKMPFNFFWAGLVHLLLPNARIVHSRRNPVATCLSIYTIPFSTTVAFASGLDDLASYYRLYRRLMDHWRAVISPNRLIEVDYEDVVAETESSARRLVSFCGLEWDSACLRPEENRDAVKTASHWQARQPIYRSSVERWRRYEPWIGELRELL